MSRVANALGRSESPRTTPARLAARASPDAAEECARQGAEAGAARAVLVGESEAGPRAILRTDAGTHEEVMVLTVPAHHLRVVLDTAAETRRTPRESCAMNWSSIRGCSTTSRLACRWKPRPRSTTNRRSAPETPRSACTSPNAPTTSPSTRSVSPSAPSAICAKRSNISPSAITALQGTRMELDMVADAAYLTFELPEEPTVPCRHRTEAYMARVVRMIELVTGTRPSPRRVAFRHAEPHDTSEHERIFAAPIGFLAPRNELTLDAKALARASGARRPAAFAGSRPARPGSRPSRSGTSNPRRPGAPLRSRRVPARRLRPRVDRPAHGNRSPHAPAPAQRGRYESTARSWNKSGTSSPCATSRKRKLRSRRSACCSATRSSRHSIARSSAGPAFLRGPTGGRLAQLKALLQRASREGCVSTCHALKSRRTAYRGKWLTYRVDCFRCRWFAVPWY